MNGEFVLCMFAGFSTEIMGNKIDWIYLFFCNFGFILSIMACALAILISNKSCDASMVVSRIAFRIFLIFSL